MNGCLTALILGVITLLFLSVSHTLLVNLSMTVWRACLRKRIGEVPADAFVPADVRLGVAPVTCLATLTIVPGFAALFLLEKSHPLLSKVLWLLCLLPFLLWVGNFLSQHFTSSERELDPMSDHQTRENENEKRIEKISRISEWISMHPSDTSLLSLYYLYWRAAYSVELIENRADLATERAASAASDLDQVISSGTSDKGLVRSAKWARKKLLTLRSVASGNKASP